MWIKLISNDTAKVKNDVIKETEYVRDNFRYITGSCEQFLLSFAQEYTIFEISNHVKQSCQMNLTETYANADEISTNLK